MLCENVIRSQACVERLRKHVHFDSSKVCIDSCRSHVNHQHNNDDKCINNNVHVSIGGFGGIEGSGGVGSVGSCGCVSSGVVRRQCKSNRGLKSRFRSNAYELATTNMISVNDDNMTTTENDDTTT